MSPQAAVPLALHLGQWLLWALVMLAPLPLVRALVQPGRGALAGAPAAVGWLAMLVIWTVLQTALALLLGLLGLLQLSGLLVGEAVLLVLGAAWLRWEHGPNRAERREQKLLHDQHPPLQPPAPAAAALGMLLGILGLSALWNLLSAPTANFDSLVYHLPAMVRWVQDGHLLWNGDGTYPMNWELLGTLFFLPLREDLLVALPNLLAWLQLGLAVLLLAERLGASRVQALAATVLLLAVPSVAGRLDAIQPDLALAATFASGLLFAHRFAARAGSTDLLLFLACLALLPGLKLSGPVYALLLVIILPLLRAFHLTDAGRSWRDWWRVPDLSRGRLLASLPALLLVAGTWYGRNWVLTGNPTGILNVELGGTALLSGPVTREFLRHTSLAALFDPAAAADWQVLWQVGRQWLGLSFAILLLLALVALVVVLFLRRGLERREGLLLCGLLAVTTILYWTSPYSGDNGEHGWRLTPWIHVGLRYGFSALALLAVLGALGLRGLRLDGRLAVLLPVAAALLTVLFVLQPPVWPYGCAVLLALAGAASWLRLPVPWPRGTRVRAAVAVALVILGATWLARGERETGRLALYGETYRVLEERVAPHAVVGTVNLLKIYPFAGRHWTRPVRPVSPAGRDRATWLAELRREDVSVLALGRGEPDPQEAAAVARVRSWLTAQDSSFQPLEATDEAGSGPALYLLRR
jgi:hypothetical protein